MPWVYWIILQKILFYFCSWYIISARQTLLVLQSKVRERECVCMRASVWHANSSCKLTIIFCICAHKAFTVLTVSLNLLLSTQYHPLPQTHFYTCSLFIFICQVRCKSIFSFVLLLWGKLLFYLLILKSYPVNSWWDGNKAARRQSWWTLAFSTEDYVSWISI